MGIKYEDIKQANETIVTTTIEKTNKRTGEVTKKEYAEVNQRIKAFRMVFPEGFIKTELLSNENGICVFKATVGTLSIVDHSVMKENILGVGHAYEKESASFINQTSYIENCETSAVGRALGMAGFGIDTSVASCEEVANAILNQEEQAEPKKEVKKASPKQIEILKKVYTGENLTKLLTANNIDKIEDLSIDTASYLIKTLKEKEAKNG